MFSAREQEVYTKALSDLDTVRVSLESNIRFDMFNKLSDSDRDCILRMNKDPEFLLSVLNDRKHPYTIDFVKTQVLPEDVFAIQNIEFTPAQREVHDFMLSNPQALHTEIREVLVKWFNIFLDIDRGLLHRMAKSLEFFKAVLKDENHLFTGTFVVQSTIEIQMRKQHDDSEFYQTCTDTLKSNEELGAEEATDLARPARRAGTLSPLNNSRSGSPAFFDRQTKKTDATDAKGCSVLVDNADNEVDDVAVDDLRLNFGS